MSFGALHCVPPAPAVAANAREIGDAVGRGSASPAAVGAMIRPTWLRQRRSARFDVHEQIPLTTGVGHAGSLVVRTSGRGH